MNGYSAYRRAMRRHNFPGFWKEDKIDENESFVLLGIMVLALTLFIHLIHCRK